MKEGTFLTKWTGVFLGNDWKEDELRHTYWSAKNKQYYGITSVVNWAIPSYGGVSDKVLAEAAEFGSNIHNEIEAFEAWGGEPDSDALKKYVECRDKNKFRVIKSEFVVSDNKRFASPIDLIADTPDCADDEVILIDIKCTRERMEEKVSLQLSFYADWFEKQTGIKVKGVYHLWFKKDKDKESGKVCVTDVEFTQVRRVESKILRQLLREYLKCTVYTKVGKLFIPKTCQSRRYTYNPYPKDLESLTKKLNRVNQQYIALEAELKMLRDQYQEEMEKRHIKAYKMGNATISLSAGRKTERFNTSKWKEEHPNEIAQYMTTSVSKPSISIKYNNK